MTSGWFDQSVSVGCCVQARRGGHANRCSEARQRNRLRSEGCRPGAERVALAATSVAGPALRGLAPRVAEGQLEACPVVLVRLVERRVARQGLRMRPWSYARVSSGCIGSATARRRCCARRVTRSRFLLRGLVRDYRSVPACSVRPRRAGAVAAWACFVSALSCRGSW